MKFLRTKYNDKLYYFPFYEFLNDGDNSIFEVVNLFEYNKILADIVQQINPTNTYTYLPLVDSEGNELSQSLRIQKRDENYFSLLLTAAKFGTTASLKYIYPVLNNYSRHTGQTIRKCNDPTDIRSGATDYSWKVNNEVLTVDTSTNTVAHVSYYSLNYTNGEYAKSPDYISARIQTYSYTFTNEVFSENYNPLDQGGISGPSDSVGSFDITSDNQDVPDLPSVSATDTGFVRLYNPSLANLRSLADFLWSDLFDLDTYKKLFGDPMGAILGLSIVPVSLSVGAPQNVVIGNVTSNVSMPVINSQYKKVECGSLTISEFWGSALDYSPYTKISIYLPYIGERSLDVDEVMGQTVSVTYNIDILNGGCVAFIKVDTRILYQFSGSVSSLIPVNSSNWQSAINGIISSVTSFGLALATKNPAAAATAKINAASQLASSVAGSKPSVSHASSLSGGVGLLGIQTPYITIQRPRQSLAADYNTFVGYPSNITSKLGDLRGYTQVEEIHLENMTATQTEIDEIDGLLKAGVLL